MLNHVNQSKIIANRKQYGNAEYLSTTLNWLNMNVLVLSCRLFHCKEISFWPAKKRFSVGFLRQPTVISTSENGHQWNPFMHCVKCVRIRVFLVRIFPYSHLIHRDIRYLSVFSPNAGKCERSFPDNY